MSEFENLIVGTPIPSLPDFRLSTGETKRVVVQVGSHPFLELTNREEFLSPIDKVYGPIPSLSRTLEAHGYRSRSNLQRFAESTVSQKYSDFLHVDIVARRESKSEVSLLIDLGELTIPKLDSFFLFPVDPNLVLSKRTSGQRRWQRSLVFHGLGDSIAEDSPIIATCSDCQTTTHFDSPSDFDCSNPTCPSRTAYGSPRDLHPGGNRRYFGPVVPNMGRVWVGVTEKLERRSDNVGILSATVYSLFHDSTDVNRQGRVSLKFPTASPRLQWSIFPYK